MKLEFHHINFVSKDVDNMNRFYTNILEMDSIPIENFPRTEETKDSGYSGKINFVTEKKIEIHARSIFLKGSLLLKAKKLPKSGLLYC